MGWIDYLNDDERAELGRLEAERARIAADAERVSSAIRRLKNRGSKRQHDAERRAKP